MKKYSKNISTMDPGDHFKNKARPAKPSEQERIFNR
jgi:hypothetical protein